jgi:colanic acid/amylovoran biosynthesis protein
MAIHSTERIPPTENVVRSVLVVNHWHDDNKGDSAITDATLHLLAARWPNANFVVRSLHSSSDPAFRTAFRHLQSAHPLASVGPSLVPAPPSDGKLLGMARWAVRAAILVAHVSTGRMPRRLRREVTRHDAVILVGGSNVFLSGRRPVFGLLRLAQVLAPALAAQQVGVPVLLLGHTVGPLKGRYAENLTQRVLAGAARVWVRESRSIDFLHRINPQLAASQFPDMAFGLPSANDGTIARLRRTHTIDDRRFIVIAPRQHPYLGVADDNRVLSELARFVDGLIDADVVDVAVVVAQCLGPTEIEDDRDVARRLVDLLGRRALMIDADLSPRELKALYGEAELLVGVRLHAAILGLSAGTPSFAISYFTDKTAGVLEGCGLADSWAEYSDISASQLRSWAENAAGPDARRRLALSSKQWASQLADGLCAVEL